MVFPRRISQRAVPRVNSRFPAQNQPFFGAQRAGHCQLPRVPAFHNSLRFTKSASRSPSPRQAVSHAAFPRATEQSTRANVRSTRARESGNPRIEGSSFTRHRHTDTVESGNRVSACGIRTRDRFRHPRQRNPLTLEGRLTAGRLQRWRGHPLNCWEFPMDRTKKAIV